MKVVALARAVPTICLDTILLSVERIYGRIFVIFATPCMAFQFRNHPYVTEGGVDPQSVVNFLKDIKGYPTHLDVRGNST